MLIVVAAPVSAPPHVPLHAKPVDEANAFVVQPEPVLILTFLADAEVEAQPIGRIVLEPNAGAIFLERACRCS